MWGDLLQGGRQSPGEEEHGQKQEGGQHGVNSGNVSLEQFSWLGSLTERWKPGSFWGDGLMNPGFQQGGSEDSMRH